jgi:hypothetical protein
LARLFLSVRSLHAQVEIKNGIIELTLSNPDGIVTGVRYNGVDNLMEILNKEDNRGYLIFYYFNFILVCFFLFPRLCF